MVHPDAQRMMYVLYCAEGSIVAHADSIEEARAKHHRLTKDGIRMCQTFARVWVRGDPPDRVIPGPNKEKTND